MAIRQISSMLEPTDNPEQVDEPKPPKLFVSYSWTNQSHIDWVIQLATDLRSYGIESIIDRWHLKEGQDAHAFMETMVRDQGVAKVILVCDRKYVDRANERKGGVGVESQIITAEIYKNTQQTKFVALALDSDDHGEPLLPSFLTSRICIDFRAKELYAEKAQQLIRWAFDKPLYREPEIGERPKFLDDVVDFEPIRFQPQAGMGHNSGGQLNFLRFLDQAIAQKSDFTVGTTQADAIDDVVYSGIKALPSLIQQILNTFESVLQERDLTDVEIDRCISYFEAIFDNYDKGSTNWSGDVTRFYGQFLITALFGRFIKLRRFDSASRLIASPLLKSSYGGITAEAKSIRRLNCYLRSLESRNARLKMNRASLHSDLIKEICQSADIDFVEFMQADFILYLALSQDTNQPPWWPDSLLYAADSHGAFPWFAKAIHAPFRDQLMMVFGVTGRQSLEALLEKIRNGSIAKIQWQSAFSTVDVLQLGNFEQILKSFG